MENTTQITITYRQWMRLVNYIAYTICGIGVSHIADHSWRDEFDCVEPTATVEIHVESARDAFEMFLMDNEPSHYRDMVAEFGKVADALIADKAYLEKALA